MMLEGVPTRLLAFAFLLHLTLAGPSAYAMQWNSTQFFGYDGPWQAVVVKVGEPEQSLNLLPGGALQSSLMSKNVANADGVEYAGFTTSTTAGIYDASLSDPSSNDSTENNAFPITSQFGSTIAIDSWWEWGPAVNLTGAALDVTDKFTFSGVNDELTIPNVSIAAVYESSWTTPSGIKINSDIGLFSLGQSSPIEIDEMTGNLVSQWLAANDVTPSNSFGLQIGSVALDIPGSLYFGGYDKARAIGDLGTYDIQNQDGDMFVDLIDINVGWASGASPFSASANLSNLLQDASGTVDSIVVRPNPTLSWLHLPGATCEALAALLPVTMNSDLGLYIWNTDDEAYTSIVQSPAYIEFVFQRSGGQSDLSIKVPFRLLNLTLSAPLASPSIPYFPCKAYTPPGASGTPDGDYHLGRAFLQAAFLGANWLQGQFWLAQAPGPGALTSSITDIENSTTIIETFTDEGLWNSSWSQYWTPIASNNSKSTASPTTSVSATTTAAASHHGTSLSTGTRAAIGISVSLTVLAILLVASFIFFRRHRRVRSSAGRLSPQKSVSSRSYSTTSSTVGFQGFDKPELESRYPPEWFQRQRSSRSGRDVELTSLAKAELDANLSSHRNAPHHEWTIGLGLQSREQPRTPSSIHEIGQRKTMIYEMSVPSPKVHNLDDNDEIRASPRETV